MYDFESLVGELLASRTELTRDELMRRIAEKKKVVGAGYLTEQGALFLVAGELGVTLQREVSSSSISIKDLYVGANDVTTIARLLAVYPVSAYKKKDGGEGKYRRLVLFDGRSMVKLTVWDEKTAEVEKLELAAGAAVRVSNGYVRQGLDGKPNLSLGKRGSIETIPEGESFKLLPLSAVTDKLSQVIQQEGSFPAMECVVESEPRYSEFVRSDGSPGSLFQFGVSEARGRSGTRVVIWSPHERPELTPGQSVVITNVRSKRSSNGELEIHGDAGSLILKGKKPEPLRMRVASSTKVVGATVLLAIGMDRKVKLVEIARDVTDLAIGTVVDASPESESDGRLFCRNQGSLKVVNDVKFPSLQELATKLKDAKEEKSLIMTDVIALSHGSTEDLRLKDGSVVRKGELVVGDDTAELRLVGWREQADRLKGIQPGERLRISGVTPKLSKGGEWGLQLGVVTVLDRLQTRN